MSASNINSRLEMRKLVTVDRIKFVAINSEKGSESPSIFAYYNFGLSYYTLSRNI